MIQVTQSAVKQLRRMREAQPPGTTRALRLSVVRGGCAGMQYEMAFVEPVEGDRSIEQEDVQIFIAPGSEPYLTGAELDFEEALSDSGFRIRNPNAARSCGCGSSFEPTGKAS